MKPSRLEIFVAGLVCLLFAGLIVGWMFEPALEKALTAAR
jgi:hypothetical protein